MPLNQRKIVEIIASKVKDIDERCPDYREELLLTLSDIIDLERRHQVAPTNIQQLIADKCSALGSLLAKNKGTNENDEDSK
jgi:hypothetical protein